jgi:hypothetical protein
MNVYMYQAALYCEECGQAVKTELDKQGKRPDSELYDSDEYPKGPFANGGGEADSPQHCDACGVFLDNSLTGDGVDYVIAELKDHLATSSGDYDILYEWAEHLTWYGLDQDQQAVLDQFMDL